LKETFKRQKKKFGKFQARKCLNEYQVSSIEIKVSNLFEIIFIIKKKEKNYFPFHFTQKVINKIVAAAMIFK